MTTAITQSSTNESTIIWAIICSILLHVLLAVVIPSIKIDPPKKPEVLEVALVSKPEPPPAVSEPEPLPEPEQPKPEPIKPKVEPKPIIKPTPTPSVIKEEPLPVTPPPQQTEVIAVTPKPEAPPSPVPVVPKPVVPTPVEIDTAHKGYGDTLWSAISKHKKYPRIAQTRGWQGEVIVELSLDGNGNLKSKRILQHSGYDSLDQQALEMVDKALPFPAPPEALRGSNFIIKVPIPFRLEAQ